MEKAANGGEGGRVARIKPADSTAALCSMDKRTEGGGFVRYNARVCVCVCVCVCVRVGDVGIGIFVH